ncbi:ParB N-terminal domain-containing protein [Streptomyces sp. NBC_01763]|uniref:ParB N-terminal domain-containing protein n=1 Tax=Streptomyces sp. NBC_01763 TaxID=2975934 RepID=UPI002DD80A66|nr:ParB N-terminal domain-containing protein [Streptomyces sp. NBC_01763]WSC35613.1 ParB/RepB/Spo0J family partition protein [Streptomyces sp. NBC_01763]
MTATTRPTRLQPRLVRRDPRLLTRLPVNARYMTKEEYDRLVENVRADGCLTSVPLVYGAGEYEEGRELVLSGNHRTDAAVDAGLDEIDVMLIDDPQEKDQLIARQISHNSIAGKDDPATLKQLYDEIEDVDWRAYSGLDDDQLQLLAEVSPEGLSEANLDFATVSLVFLPLELEAAREAFDQARLGQNASWLAARADYEQTLDTLASTHAAHKVGNVATALHAILTIVENHLTDLQAGYQSPDGESLHSGTVGLETVLGARSLPAPAAVTINKAISAAEGRGEIEQGQGWRLLERLAGEYLSGENYVSSGADGQS